MPLKAAQLLEQDVLETTVVSVPEWARNGDCQVMIRMMDGFAMSVFEARTEAAQRDVMADSGADDAAQADDAETVQRAQHELRRRLMVEYVAASIVDPETLELVYDTPAKIEILGKKRGMGLRRIFNAASKLNRDTTEDIEELRKNFGGTAGSGSGSNTPGSTATDTPTDSSGT